MTPTRITRRFAMVVLALTASACLSPRSDPSRFYMLAPTAEMPTGNEAAPLSVGVGPVVFPAYLDRPQLVTRVGPNQVTLSEYDRWVSPVAADFTQTVVTNLSRLLGATRIWVHPWYANDAPAFAVAIDVLHFEAQSDGTVTLECAWSIRDVETNTELVRREASYAEPVLPADVGAAVAGLSRLVERLSREIADAVRQAAAG